MVVAQAGVRSWPPPPEGGAGLGPDDPVARQEALAQVLGFWARLSLRCGDVGDEAAAGGSRWPPVRDQDVDCPARCRRCAGRGKDRRISVEDADMRHGRKSRSVLFDGYKRHVLTDLDTGLIPAVGITAANVPEAAVTGDIETDLQAVGRTLAELHIDRAGCPRPGPRPRAGPGDLLQGLAGPQRRGRFAKDQFSIDFAAGQLTCPAGVTMPFEPGKTVRFPKRHLRRVPAAGPLHRQPGRAQRRHPPRRGAAGRAAPAPADPGRPGETARARPGRARAGPRRPLAGPPRPLPRHPQEPVRPAPRRRRPQPPRHRPPARHRQLPGSRLTAT